MARAKSLEEAMKELMDELSKQIVSAGSEPTGSGKAVRATWDRGDEDNEDNNAFPI